MKFPIAQGSTVRPVSFAHKLTEGQVDIAQKVIFAPDKKERNTQNVIDPILKTEIFVEYTGRDTASVGIGVLPYVGPGTFEAAQLAFP